MIVSGSRSILVASLLALGCGVTSGNTGDSVHSAGVLEGYLEGLLDSINVRKLPTG